MRTIVLLLTVSVILCYGYFDNSYVYAMSSSHITIKNPSSSSLITGSSSGIKVTFNGISSSETGPIKNVQVKFGSSSYINANPIYVGDWSQWSLPYTILHQGHNIPITAKAVDGSGNQVYHTIYVDVYFDYKAPSTTVSPNEGYYNKTNISVTLSANEPATTYYTTDGSTPTKFSAKYTGPITLSKSTVLKYFSIDTSGNTGSISTDFYSLGSSSPIPIGIYGSMTQNFDIYAGYLITQFDIAASYYPSFPNATHENTSSSLDGLQYDATYPAKGFFKGDYLNYDMEHWPNTPIDEQTNPKSSIQKACAIAHNNGYLCSIVPDRGFLLNIDPLTNLPYYKTYDYTKIDKIVIQAENFELTSDFKFIPVVANWIKSHSPNTKIMIEVGLQNPCNKHGICDITQVVNLIMDDLKTVPQLDGVFLLHQSTNSCTLCTAQNEDQLLENIRTLQYVP